MDAKTNAIAILEGIKKAGIDLITSLPDINCLDLINALERDTPSNMCRCVVKKRVWEFAPALDWSARNRRSSCRMPAC